MTDDSREFDLVLVGGTGYVGRLTAAELARQAPADCRIAMAGRSAERLAGVAADLGPVAQEWPRLTLGTLDIQAVAELAARTRVVASTVGPYLRYGLPLVAACAAAGTHYADLTGELLFVRRSIDACHATASASGARIVHSCGFDSVPSDLGVGLAAARAASEGAGELRRAVLHVRSLRGGISGGTIDSLRQQIIETSGAPALRALASDPAALVNGATTKPSTARPAEAGRSAPRRLPVSRDGETGRWQTPFLMGGFNRQIVLRSNSLSGSLTTPDFGYREVVDSGPGPVGLVRAVAWALGSSAFLGAMWFPPTRSLLDRVLPSPGQGPSEQTRRRGRFLVQVVAETTRKSRYVTTIGADLDPGYGATAVMFAQAALALALDRDLPDRAGVLTPRTAMGQALAARLRARGFTLSIERLD